MRSEICRFFIYLIILRGCAETMLAGVRNSVSVGITRVAIFFRVIVLCDRARFSCLRGITVAGRRCALTTKRTTAVTTATLRLRGYTTFLRIRRRGTGRRFATCRSSCFFFGRTCPRVARVANTSERPRTTSSMRSVVIRSRRFLPQIVELNEFRLKILICIKIKNSLQLTYLRYLKFSQFYIYFSILL